MGGQVIDPPYFDLNLYLCTANEEEKTVIIYIYMILTVTFYVLGYTN